MVALVLAPAVHGLAVVAAEHVHEAVVELLLQGPVHGGQRDAFALVLEAGMELLRAHEVRDAVQGSVDGGLLPGRPGTGGTGAGLGGAHGAHDSFCGGCRLLRAVRNRSARAILQVISGAEWGVE